MLFTYLVIPNHVYDTTIVIVETFSNCAAHCTSSHVRSDEPKDKKIVYINNNERSSMVERSVRAACDRGS
jgi:hypothetical protein